MVGLGLEASLGLSDSSLCHTPGYQQSTRRPGGSPPGSGHLGHRMELSGPNPNGEHLVILWVLQVTAEPFKGPGKD